MPVQERISETPSGKIHYRVSRAETSEKWLVFLPGLTADHHLFDRQMEYFASRCSCLVWDAPAHGKSRPFELNFTMDDIARWLHAIFLAEQVCAPVLVGQSLGGYVAQVYMELYPGEASGFISIDSCSLKRKYYTRWELWLLKRTKWMYLSFPWKLLKACAVMGTSVTACGRSIMRRTVDSYEKKEYCALSDHGMRIFAEAVETERAYTKRWIDYNNQSRVQEGKFEIAKEEQNIYLTPIGKTEYIKQRYFQDSIYDTASNMRFLTRIQEISNAFYFFEKEYDYEKGDEKYKRIFHAGTIYDAKYSGFASNGEFDLDLFNNKKREKQVSEMVGIRQPTISAICTGQIKEIPVHVIEKLCRILNCQPNDIMEYIPDEE